MDDMTISTRHVILILILLITLTAMIITGSYLLHSNRTELQKAQMSLDACYEQWDLVPMTATLDNVCTHMTNTTATWTPYHGGRFFVCDSNDTKTVIT